MFCIILILALGIALLKKMIYEKAMDTPNNFNYINNENSTNELDNTVVEPTIDISKIDMKIKDGTLRKTGTTIIITDNNKIPYIYDNSFRIDKKIGQEWKQLDPINPDAVIDELAQPIENSKKHTELDIDWSQEYGELKKGQYRLIKYIYGYIEISAEFEIE